MPNQRVKFPTAAVVFDLDDTLFDDTTSFQQAAENIATELQIAHGADPRLVIETYVRELSVFWECLTTQNVTGRITGMRAHVWSRTLEQCGLSTLMAAEIARRYDELRRPSFVLWPGVVDLLTDLRQAGSKLAILTNGLHETHREKIALLGVEPLVDGIYISDEIGMAKPDPKVFELVCRELGVEPANATMVGDRYSRDISGALAVGMKTIFLDLRAEEIPIGSPGPDLTVKDIQTAAEALRASLPA